MLKNDTFFAGLATVYLLIYLVLLQFENTQRIGFMMLLLFPVLVGWMVYVVLKHGKYNISELENEEFGYQDKPKDQLGIF